MRSNVEQLVVLGALLGLCPHLPSTAGQASPTPPEPPGQPTFSVGQEWILLVRQYNWGRGLSFSDSRMQELKLIPRVQREYHVKARVTELTEGAGRQYVRIRFTAESDAPDFPSTTPPKRDYIRTLEYALTLDAQTWQVVELKPNGESTSEEQVRPADGPTAALPAAAFPVGWIVALGDLENPTDRTEIVNFAGFQPTPDRPSPNTALRRTVFHEPDGSVRITVGQVSLFPCQKTGRPPEEALRECEQVWRPNELWWRSFRSYDGGHIDLEATLVSDPGGSGVALEVPIAPQSPAPHVPAGATWTVGQEWRVLVKDYADHRFGPRGAPPRVRCEYHLRVRVTELTQEDGRPCARLEFLPEDDAPGMYSAVFTLVVETQTWSPVRFEYPKRHGGVRRAAEAQGYRGLLPTMPGVPLDWVVQRSDLGSRVAREEFLHFPGLRSVTTFGFRRAVSAPRDDGTLRITVGLWVPRQDSSDMTYEPAQDAMCEVEQVWHPNELWWRSFRRSSHGHVEVEATRVPE